MAFEIAQQLRVAGEQVALVVLFDTASRYSYSFAERIRLRLRALKHSSPGARLRCLTRSAWVKVRRHVTEWHENAERLVCKIKHLNPRPVSAEQRGVYLQMAFVRAVSSYRPRAYPGRVTLFRAQHPDDDGYEHASDYGWSEYAQDGMDIYDVPGAHLTIFGPANVRALAEKLDARIRAALAQYNCG